ncbi:uncharacterized protein J3R85_002334 [Psidium guajava]|nr:uncharacterized protein J3R85_002334 [Psidium guajava]
MDLPTEKNEKNSFARVCVKIRANQHLPKLVEVQLDENAEPCSITVEYEWKPISCEKCGIFGHKCTVEDTPEEAAKENHPQPQNAWTTVDRRKRTSTTQVEKENLPTASLPKDPLPLSSVVVGLAALPDPLDSESSTTSLSDMEEEIEEVVSEVGSDPFPAPSSPRPADPQVTETGATPGLIPPSLDCIPGPIPPSPYCTPSSIPECSPSLNAAVTVNPKSSKRRKGKRQW